MKKIIPLLIILLTLVAMNSKGSDTLFYRFNNYYVIDGTPFDTMVFDLEIKSSTAGTYLTCFQTDIIFDTITFGTWAQPVSIAPYYLPDGVVSTDLTLIGGPANPTKSVFRYGMKQLFAPFNPATLGLVPNSSWGRLIKYKMLVLNNSQNVGLNFQTTFMATNQKFVLALGSQTTNYAPIVASNNLLTLPAQPTNTRLLISELGDPSNSNADFVEIYNAGSNTVNFSAGASYFLTVYNGSTYQNFQLTGNLAAGDSYVVGGTSYFTAYPGKAADQTNALVDQNGAVSWYLTLGSAYSTGFLIDRYNGTTSPFTGKHAVRRFQVVYPNATFTSSEWGAPAATNMDMTPGSHRVTLTWDGTSSSNWRDTSNWTPSYVPDLGHDAVVPDNVLPLPVISTGNEMNCHDLINGATGSK